MLFFSLSLPWSSPAEMKSFPLEKIRFWIAAFAWHGNLTEWQIKETAVHGITWHRKLTRHLTNPHLTTQKIHCQANQKKLMISFSRMAGPIVLNQVIGTRDLMLFDVVWRVMMRSANTIYNLPSKQFPCESDETKHFNSIQLQILQRQTLLCTAKAHCSLNSRQCWRLGFLGPQLVTRHDAAQNCGVSNE